MTTKEIMAADEALQIMEQELRNLRRIVREAGEGFILRKEGEIEALLGYLHNLPPAELGKVSRGWLREARDLHVKPAKGRIKDLRRIDALLEDLLNRVVDAEYPADDIQPSVQRPLLHLELIHPVSDTSKLCGA